MADKKIILELDIKVEAARKHVDELNKSIEKSNEVTKQLLKEKGKENAEYQKSAKSLQDMKQQQKDATKVLREQERERLKAIKTVERQRAKWQDIIKASQMEARTNDELRQKLNALIAIRDKTTVKGSAAYNKLTGSIQKLDKEVKANNASIGRHQGNVGNYPKIMAGAVAAAGALIMAFRQISRVVKQSIDAFLVQEDISLKVSNTFGEYSKQINDAADATQALTRVGNEQYQKLAVLASNMGIANGQVNQTVQDSIGLAELFAASGLSQETAMKGLALARQGDYTQLQRYIPALKNANTEAEKQAILNDITAKGFDLAQKNAESYQGRLTQMKNAYGDLQEVVGGQILGGIFDPKEGNNIVDIINKISEALDKTNFIGTLMQKWAAPFGKFIDLFKQLAEIFGVAADGGSMLEGVMTLLTKTFELTTVPIKMLLGFIKGLINYYTTMYEILTNIKDAKFEDIWTLIEESIFAIIEPITDLIGVTRDLKNAFGLLGDELPGTTENIEKLHSIMSDPLGVGKDYYNQQKELEEQANETAAALKAEAEAIDAANKAYQSWQDTLKSIRDELDFQLYFAKTTDESNKAIYESMKKNFDATKQFFASGGYTGDELAELKELENEMLAFQGMIIEDAEDVFEMDEKTLDAITNNINAQRDAKIAADEAKIAANTKWIEDKIATDEAELLAEEDTQKKKQEIAQKYYEKYSSIAQGFTEQVTGMLQNSIGETGFSMQKFGQQFSLFILDLLEKQVTASIASATAQSFAQPDSVATAGISGGIRAGILAGLIKGAFTVVKSLISQPSKFESGGLLSGARHSQGGITIEAEDGEAIINRNATAQYLPILSAINQSTGGVPLMENGGVAGFSSTGTATTNINPFKDVKIVATIEDINAGLSKESQRMSIASSI